MQVLKQSQAGEYSLTFRQNENQYELVLRYQGAGNHFAVHTDVQLLDSQGRFLNMQPISPD
jgi:hypothetical protein